MIWLPFVNKILLLVAIGLTLFAATIWWREEPELTMPTLIQVDAPPPPFEQTPEAYAAIGETVFRLERKPPTVHLPDLRDELIFYGLNQRPDCSAEEPQLHLGIKGIDDITSAQTGERRYLSFDKQRGNYRFSTSNRETNLWITPDTSEEGEVLFHLHMLTHDGKEVTEPKEQAEFTLPYTAHNPRQNGGWQLDNLRVDNSLLARLRTRWFGEDLFLTKHGGTEYSEAQGRQRIDFGESPNTYSCYLAPGEYLVWRAGKWWKPEEGEKTDELPLLHLRRLDQRLIVFDLWDAEGRRKISLSLMKSRSGWGSSGTRETLRFVAAKTWSQLVLEAGTRRIDVAPGDWLLFEDQKIRKLETIEEIEAYVNRQLPGELMVIDCLERREGKQMLISHLFNKTRTDIREHAIPLTSSTGSPPPPIVRAREERLLLEEPPDLPETLDKEAFEEENALLGIPKIIRGMVKEQEK